MSHGNVIEFDSNGAPSTEAVEAVEAEPVPGPPRRFCGRCGGTISEEDGLCLGCRPAAGPGPAGSSGFFGEPTGEEAPSLQASLGLYFMMLAVSLVLTASVMITGDDITPTGDLVATSIFSAIIALFAVRYRRSLAPLLTRTGPPRYYFYAAAASVGTLAVASAAIGLLEMLGAESFRYTDDYVAEAWGWWAPVLAVAVLPAVFEEMAFRGLLTRSLQRYLSGREAMFVSAGLFAMLHLSVPAIPHLFLMAVVLSLLTSASGSLYPAMLLHFCHNGLVILIEQWEVVRPW